MTDSKSPGDRLLELVVYGPAGLAVTVAEEFPKLVEKGRHRVEGQVRTARLVGQFAVQMGRRQIEQSFADLGGSRAAPVAAPPPSTWRRTRCPRPPRRRADAPTGPDPALRRPAPAGRDDMATAGVDGGGGRQRQRIAVVARHPRVRQPLRVAGGPAPGRAVGIGARGGARPRGRGTDSAAPSSTVWSSCSRRRRRPALTGDGTGSGPARGGHAAGVGLTTRTGVPSCAGRLSTSVGDGPRRVAAAAAASRLLAQALLRPGGLAELLVDPRRRVLVGTVDDSVVGLAMGTVEESGGHALVGIIDGYFVEVAARGVGVGRALLDELVVWFASSGCGGVDVSALPGDREAKSLLEASGFKARLLTMHRTLA